jgi:SNF2 family DNA or RNA helicase
VSGAKESLMLQVGKTRIYDIETIELLVGGPDKIMSYADFRQYQRWMTRLILDNDGVYLAADMGLGKTAVSLCAINTLLRVGEIKMVLIIAPKLVAETSWPEEFSVWTFARKIPYTVITGTEEERLDALKRPAKVHIINRENFEWLRQYWGRKFPYDMLVYDEASRLKEGRSRTIKAKRPDGTERPRRLSEFGSLARIRHRFSKVVELSGTPSPNGYHNLWGPIYIIDGGRRLGTFRTSFENRWFHRDLEKHKLIPFEHSGKEIMERISDVFFALKSEDYIDLPPLVVVDRKVRFPPDLMKKYKKFEREYALQEWDVEAVNRGVLTNKLLQLANGSIYRDDKSEVKIHDLKIKALESIVEESEGKPILVAYNFKFDLKALKKRFKHARVFGDTPNDKRDWNEGKIKMLLVHPASAGHGINFQHGGNIAVMYGLTWSLELYQQFIKRLHRSGQKADRVFLYHIVAEKTADETVLSVLKSKKATQDRITDAVRVRMKRVARDG